MATLSLRMRDDLKQKAQQLAKNEGVSLNSFINATIAAAVAQQETLALFSDRLKDVDEVVLHERVLNFMQATQPGDEPGSDIIEQAVRGKPNDG